MDVMAAGYTSTISDLMKSGEWRSDVWWSESVKVPLATWSLFHMLACASKLMAEICVGRGLAELDWESMWRIINPETSLLMCYRVLCCALQLYSLRR